MNTKANQTKPNHGRKTILFLILTISFSSAYSQLSLDLETGIPFPGYNEVRIPNKTGTTFDFNNDFKLQGPVIPLRLKLGYTFAGKNHLFALFAPLELDYEGSVPFDISFRQSLFTAGQMIEGFYKFNSYRLGS